MGRIDGIGHRITGDRTGQSNKRGTGWEALHVAIDDNSRLAYTEILRREEDEGHSLPRAGARLLPAPAVDLKGGDPAAFNRALVFLGQVEAYAAARGESERDKLQSRFTVGSSFVVKEGPFASFIAEVELLTHDGKVATLINIFNRLVRAEFDPGQLEAPAA